jgi:hypothetical protein
VAGADVDSVRVSCTQRTYTIGGTAEGVRGALELGLDGGEVLRVTQAGRFTFTTKRPRGGAYAVSVTTEPPNQRCVVSNGSGTVAGNVEGISVRCHDWFVLDSTQAAKTVIGQTNFANNSLNQGGPPGDTTLSGPWGNPALAGGRLYVTDQGSHRILGFNGVPTAPNATAELVLGQSSFTSTDLGNGQSGIGNPESLSSDGTRLALADTRNGRVLLYTPLPSSTGALPALVIGRPDFVTTVSSDATCNQQSLNFPEDVFIGHGKMLVADSSNNRVLVWNSIPTTSGVPADLVLGQQSFTTCAQNDADGDSAKDLTPGASTLWNPTGVWTDGTRLVVADSYNNRVLIWNQFPTTRGQAADRVLGQASFTTGGEATTATGMKAPYYVTSTGLQLFVVDQQNHRVLGWNQFPTTDGATANFVLGQPDLTSAWPYDPVTGGDPSALSLNTPSGVLLAWPYVVVSDAGNHRVLVYESR